MTSVESNSTTTSFPARKKVGIKSTSTPRRIDIADLTPNNIGQLRRLNSVLFPVVYTDKFYKEVLQEDRKDVCKLGQYKMLRVRGESI